ncbi:cell division initiation protein [Kitasatospora sp. SUK 42]|uniref:cell division initiation protein n=1 Tax=Kitasatospora sp. SUK 42 TaxID=1588882 RepID=UPI0018C96361|nr:cell division initiation protein [Kitasatospora sp. SUK 42]MBV2151823.1 cell division initiation protein [Kitasatospora sp. SUK 42]
MDVQNKVDEIVAAVENARSMPMSASCVVNRAELIGLLNDLKAALPAELAQAQSVMADHEQVVAGAQAEAERIIQGAHAERGSLISDTEVVHRAQAEADRILAEARTEVETKRAEADDYVDSKLANFEVVLTKTLGAVGRGRTKLRGDSSVFEAEQQGETDGEEFQPQRISPSPEVDEYVDVKLATLESVLGATLEAVGKGRDKLLGKRPIDELGAYLAAADQAQQAKERAEAVAAGFAEDANGDDIAWYREDVPQQQTWPEQTPAAAGWQDPGADQYAAAQQQGGQYAEVYGGGYEQAVQGDPYQAQWVDQQQGGYPQQQDYQGQQQGGYGYQQQGYGAQQYDGYDYPQPPAAPPAVPHQQQGLEETSFFDTSMIDMTRLRELGGR